MLISFLRFFTPLRLMDANVSYVIGSVPQIQINGRCFAGFILSSLRTAVFFCVLTHVCVCLENVNEKELRCTLLSHNAVRLDLQTTHFLSGTSQGVELPHTPIKRWHLLMMYSQQLTNARKQEVDKNSSGNPTYRYLKFTFTQLKK